MPETDGDRIQAEVRAALDEQRALEAEIPPLPMAGLEAVLVLLRHTDAHERQRGVIKLRAVRQSDEWQRADAVTRATDATWLSKQAPRFADAIRITLGATGRLGRWFDAEVPSETEADVSLWRCASDVRVRAVPWLWRKRLARGEVTLLDGDPGAGKSLIAATLAACITTGRPFPDGDTNGGAHEVTWIGHAGEDAAEYVTVPRFVAAGGNPDRLQVLDTRRDTDLASACLSAANEHHPRLAVIDSWAAWNDGTDDNDGPAVRDRFMALQPLRDTGAAILLIAHDRKSEADNPVHQVAGSVQATAAPRMALRVANDEVKQTKGNLGGPGPVLTFTIESATAVVDDRTVPTARIVWLEVPTDAPRGGELVSYDAVIDALIGSEDGLTLNQVCTRLSAAGAAKRQAIARHLAAAVRQRAVKEVTVKRRGVERTGYINHIDQHRSPPLHDVADDVADHHRSHHSPFRGVNDDRCTSDGEPDAAPADTLIDALNDVAPPDTHDAIDEAAIPDAGQLAALADMHDDPDKRRAMLRRIQPLIDSGWTPSGILDRWPKAAIEVALGMRPLRDGEKVASGHP